MLLLEADLLCGAEVARRMLAAGAAPALGRFAHDRIGGEIVRGGGASPWGVCALVHASVEQAKIVLDRRCVGVSRSLLPALGGSPCAAPTIILREPEYRSMQPIVPSTASVRIAAPEDAPAAPRAAREAWIDHLRVWLTALVVLHHAAITYGARGSWFYHAAAEPNAALTAFAALNQAFFMGAFFLLAGLLAPRSLARKGGRAFLADRAVRLGLPVLAFGFVLGPLTVSLATAPASGILQDLATRMARLDFVLGPLWFPAALLVMSGALVLLPPRTRPSRETPAVLSWVALALATGLAALAVRQVVPVGETLLGFQLGYFASYVVLFAVGVLAGNGTFRTPTTRRQLGTAAFVGLLALPILPLGLLLDPTGRVETGLSPAAIAYAFWEPLVATGVIAGLVVAARALPAGGRLWSAAAACSYGAFVLHAPILVAASRALESLGASHAIALPVSAATTIVAAFVATAALRRSASIRNVL